MQSTPDEEHDTNGLDERSGEVADEGRATVPVVEETFDVEVHERTTGGVRVTTRTELDEHVVEEILASVSANVTRVPIERELAPGEPLPRTRTEEGLTIVPVFEERLVVEKRLVLVEEIRIESRSERERIAVPVSVRRQRVDVDRLSANEVSGEVSGAHVSDSHEPMEN